MAARLTDRQRKRILADYVELGTYSAAAKKHGVSRNTVKAIVAADGETAAKCQKKKEQNTADVLAYMETQRQVVCEILGKGLAVLNDEEKLRGATPAQITTALGTLIDKWTAGGAAGRAADEAEEDPITRALREEARKRRSDG